MSVIAAAAMVATRARSDVMSPAAVGVQPAGEDDHVAPGGRIQPEARASEAGVAERAHREQLAARRRVRRVDVPAQPAYRRHAGRRRAGRHAGHGGGGEHPHAIQRPARQQHPGKPRQIRGRAEQPCVASDATHPTGGRIVHHAAERRRSRPLARPLVHLVAALGRRDAGAQALSGEESGVAHGKRGEHHLSRVDVQRLAARHANDLAEQEVVDVAVDETLARRRGQHFVAGERDGRVIALPGVREVQVGPEPGDVSHQVSHGDGALPVALEPGHVGRDGVVQADAPLFDQGHHRRGRRHDLGKRRQIEHRIESHRLPGRHGGPGAVCLEMQDLRAAADEHDCPGGLACGDGPLDHPVDAVEAGGAGWGLGVRQDG